MADSIVPCNDALGVSRTHERELLIEIMPDEWVRYVGAAAQLEGEGLIPNGLEWPRAAANKYWQADGFDYWLRRTRPIGHKGPMRSWLELDNWMIRVKVTGRDYYWNTHRELQRKADELAAAYHRQTPDGSREWNAKWKRYQATCNDERFQAFKALVPGLVPPKRGRKPKTQASGGDL